MAHQLETVKTLLGKGAALNTQNEAGQTALYLAVRLKSPALVSRLLAKGADPSLKNLAGQSALSVAGTHFPALP